MELVFYTNPQSRGRMARWMLEEVGAPYRTERIAYGPAMKGPDYCAINPMGKVPALKHGETVVTETGAIIAYLADAFPAAGLAPALGDPARGAYFRWLFFAAGPIEAAVLNKTIGAVVPPERKAMAGYGSFELMIEVMEQAVTPGPYVLGERFSAADVYFGSEVGFGLRFGWLPKRPAFEAYLARLMARPAWGRANALDDALAAA